MQKTKKLKELISEQENLLREIKAEAQAIDADSLVEQNEALTQELAKKNESLTALTSEKEKLEKELSGTKAALFAKLADEKLNVFTSVQRRIDSMYYLNDDMVTSRLKEYEDGCRRSLDETIKAVEQFSGNQFGEINEKLNALKAELDEKAKTVEAVKSSQLAAMANHNNALGDKLRNEPLTESEKRAGAKQKSIETFVGLNVLSKAGILLFIVGIVMLGRYAYIYMSDVFKGSVIFLLGAVLIGIGELFHKKEKTVFSQALISGGVAVLYAAAATCYFAFSLYSVRVTFIICILITAIAIAISNQLKSQIVCTFGAIGGYLPVVAAYMITFGSAAADKSFLPVSGVYFCLLAAIIFIMTYNKKWYVPQFVGYALHLISIGGIASCAVAVNRLPGYSYSLRFAVGYAIVSFIIYMLMPASRIVSDREISVSDRVLLLLNTLSGAISVSITIRSCFFSYKDGNRAMGIVFLVFACIYAILTAFSVRNRKSSGNAVTAITSVAALVFSMLVVPLVFGMDYTPIAWAAEGMLLAVISINKQIKISEIAGAICLAMSFCAGIFTYDMWSKPTISIIGYSVVAAAFWIYTVMGLLECRSESKNPTFYSLAQLVTAAGTVILLHQFYLRLMRASFVSVSSEFTNYSVAILLTLAMAVIVRRGVLGTKIASFISSVTGLILVPALGFCQHFYQKFSYFTDYYYNQTDCKTLWVINLVLVFVTAIAVLLFFAKSAGDLINGFELPVWSYSLALSVASLLLITTTLMTQFDVKFYNVIISAVYIVTACVMLFIGFRRLFTVIRSGGLVLILIAFAKLCFVDTFKLDSGWKIASYFAFGAILILISYVYQRFSKRLEQSVNTEEQD